MASVATKNKITVQRPRRIPVALKTKSDALGKEPVVVLADIVSRNATIAGMARELGVSRQTMYRVLDRFKDQLEVVA
mgnify:CR=1 FL=1